MMKGAKPRVLRAGAGRALRNERGRAIIGSRPKNRGKAEKNMLEKLHSGELYDPNDPEILEVQLRSLDGEEKKD